MDSKLPLYFFSKEKAVSLLKGAWEVTEIPEGEEVVSSDLVMQVPSSPCSLLYDPCHAKTRLQKYSREMSMFCGFLNLSWDLNVLLTSCCPPEMDELVNAWPGEGES